MTWVGRDSFRPAFYFSDVKSDKVDLDFEIEGCEPLWISNISVHAHPDAMYREFEHGLVVANPAPHPYTLPLGSPARAAFPWEIVPALERFAGAGYGRQ